MNKYITYAPILLFANSIVIANTDKKYNQIIENLRCLVCQNQSLSESDSNLAKDLRNKVKNMLQWDKQKKKYINSCQIDILIMSYIILH